MNLGFKRVCARAGLGSDWHPHEQRHTFVSVLSDAGVDIELIADATGHINSTVTREVYRHQITDKVVGKMGSDWLMALSFALVVHRTNYRAADSCVYPVTLINGVSV